VLSAARYALVLKAGSSADPYPGENIRTRRGVTSKGTEARQGYTNDRAEKKRLHRRGSQELQYELPRKPRHSQRPKQESLKAREDKCKERERAILVLETLPKEEVAIGGD